MTDLSQMRVDHQDNLTHVSFKDTAFLQMCGLNEYNVLDYFSLSQFYDKSCINEQLKMQARYNELQAAQLDRRQMTGLDYELWYFTHQPSLYVIRKHMRFSPTRVDLLAVYYIVDGTIYQAPDAHSILTNRLRTSMYFLRNAFSQLEESGYRFDPIQGYAWEADYEAYVATTKSKQQKKEDHDAMNVDTQQHNAKPESNNKDSCGSSNPHVHVSFDMTPEEALEAVKKADAVLSIF